MKHSDWGRKKRRLLVQDNLLNNLSLEQVEKALECLYLSQPPQEEPLVSLSEQEWLLLSNLLCNLLKERNHSPLH